MELEYSAAFFTFFDDFVFSKRINATGQNNPIDNKLSQPFVVSKM
jgi:hypothetical protein